MVAIGHGLGGLYVLELEEAEEVIAVYPEIDAGRDPTYSARIGRCVLQKQVSVDSFPGL